jgi:hypothetical protein
MIDYTSKKRFYTKGQVFNTLSGSDYVGYVTVLSGVPYVDNTSIPLSSTATFECNYLLSNYSKDRDVNEILTLPFNADSILFGGNDFLTYNLFLDKLKKLHDNNIFVYTKLFMANNDLPVKLLSGGEVMDYSYACIPNSNTPKLTAVSSLVQSVPFSTSSVESIKELGNIKRFVARLKDDIPTDYAVFAITDSGFTTLSGNKNECEILETYSPFIESNENELAFGLLNDITLSNGYAFITDELNSVIYKYDVSGYYNGDLALANKRNLIEILGGDGPQGSKNLFKTPKHITSNESVIIINDSGNNVLKVFDTNFNYITRITSLPLSKEPVAALQINNFFNTLYVFTRDLQSRQLNLYIIDLNCYKILEVHKAVEVPLQNTEVINTVEFSKVNTDYYYICTDRNVYKLFVNKPKVLIGRYQELQLDYVSGTKTIKVGDKIGTEEYVKERISITPSNQWRLLARPFIESTWNWGSLENTNFIDIYDVRDVYSTEERTVPNLVLFNDTYKGISFLPTQNEYDSVVFITDGRVYFFNETNTFKQVIKTDKLQAFGSVNMTLNSEEYIQTSTINKELYKVVRDILTLKNNLIGRFTGYYDVDNILTLDDYNYNLDFNSFKLIQPQDYYVHENEKSLVTVLNRVFNNIFNLQEQLISLTTIDNTSVKKELYITPFDSAIKIS